MNEKSKIIYTTLGAEAAAGDDETAAVEISAGYVTDVEELGPRGTCLGEVIFARGDDGSPTLTPFLGRSVWICSPRPAATNAEWDGPRAEDTESIEGLELSVEYRRSEEERSLERR